MAPGRSSESRIQFRTSASSAEMTASEAANYTIAKIIGGAWTPSYSQ
jgi:hypothetical protein